MKKVKRKLTTNQRSIDLNKNGRIDKIDFMLLRKKKQ